jgi:two-component system cell cycle response regulator DivK
MAMKSTKTLDRKYMKTKYDWSGKTILVAEDIYTNFLLLEAIMKGTNANLIWAKDGREAVDKCLNTKNIDLVLMDIQMPVMNGIEAAREIKKIRKDLPIIAQTAFSTYYDEDDIIEAGCSQVLTKPIMPDFVLHTVGKYI